jgi:hypothetical protein
MAPKRSTRARGYVDEVEPQGIRGRTTPAVQGEMPPLMNRMSTAYGSPVSTRIRNPRRGQVRNLRDIVQQVLDEDDTVASEDGESTVNPERQPTTEVVPDPQRRSESRDSGVSQDHPLTKPRQPGTRREARSSSEVRVNPFSAAARDTRQGSAPLMPTPMDTSKSFGTESGIFGSATIPSTPASRTSKRLSGTRKFQSINEEGQFDLEQPRWKPNNALIHGPESESELDSNLVRSPPAEPSPYAAHRRVDARPLRNQTEGQSIPRGDIGDTHLLLDQAETALTDPVRRRQERQEGETQLLESNAQRPSVAKPKRSAKAVPVRSMKQNVAPNMKASEGQSSEAKGPSIFSGLQPSDTNEEVERLRQRQSRFSRFNKVFQRPLVAAHEGTEERAPITQVGPNTDPPAPVWRVPRFLNRFFENIRDTAQPALWAITSYIQGNYRSFATFALTLVLAVLLLPILSRLPSPTGLHWYGWSGLSYNIGQFIPYQVLHPFSSLSGENATVVQKLMRDYEYDMVRLKKSNSLHDASLEALRKIVPKVVHMNLDRNGRPILSQDFWHALREEMKKDDSVLTLDKQGAGYKFTSDRHWESLKKRLEIEGLANTSAMSPSDVDGIVERSIGSSWEKWVHKNQQKVAEILGPLGNQQLPENVDKLAKQGLVSKDFFLRHLKSEFATHRREIKAEVMERENALDAKIRATLKQVKEEWPAAEVNANELKKVVDHAIHKAIGKAGLGAMANGKIHANWDAELKHQVNFFGIGSGARINARHSSPTFNPPVGGKVGSKEWRRSIADKEASPAIAALVKWDDDGECWCGAIALDRHGRPAGTSLAVQLGHTIIPQNVVVEHIVPGATLDGAARPKDIEVWAYIEEYNQRKRVEDFSSAHFPEGDKPPPPYDGFVKVGQFTYETSEVHDGVHVHRLSPELGSLNAVTDGVIVRAVTNYGAKDHTCFYRVRLYGELRDAA